jgi:hypothetical protein
MAMCVENEKIIRLTLSLVMCINNNNPNIMNCRSILVIIKRQQKTVKLRASCGNGCAGAVTAEFGPAASARRANEWPNEKESVRMSGVCGGTQSAGARRK